MNFIKKLPALLLTLILSLTLATSAAFAEENVNNETPTHTYDIYQIFTGTQAADDTEGKLVVTDWGTGIKGTEFLAALKAEKAFGTGDENIFKDATNAKEVSEVLANADAAQARAFGDLASGYLTTTKTKEGVTGGKVTLDAGYYLLVDTTDVADSADAKNVSLLQVTKKGDFEIKKKYDVPTVEKKVQDINDTTDTQKGAWQDSADYDIGDDVSFKLTGSLPSNYADYTTYYYQFNDTLSAGLTYNNDAKVYAVNDDARTEITQHFTTTDLTSIACTNLKAIDSVKATTKIVVEYTARLNENAKIGAEGNPNTVNLTFSNNPNNGGEGDKGKTPDDTVIVFTYKVIVNKVDENNAPLAGAEFTLSKKMQDGTEKVVAVVKTNEGKTFEFKGIDDGQYVLRETKAPAGYNGIDDITFTVTATHEILADAPTLQTLTGTGDITLTPNVQDGTLSTDVVNKSGSVLPETGGIGTTLFYTVGGLLVVGAGVLLVAKKRMSETH